MTKLKTITGIGFVFLVMGCSSITFIPREGTASKFNLATVEYVNQMNQSQNEKIIEQLQGQLESVVTKVTEPDREKIADLEAQIAAQAKLIENIQASVDSTRNSVQMVSGRLLKDISDLKASNKNTQFFINQFKSEVEKLPEKALKEFDNAINDYLKKSNSDQ